MFRLVPLLVRADAQFGAGGELDDDVFKTEVGINLEKQIDKIRDFVLDLILGTENMRTV